MTMHNTPYNSGIAFISQCPIPNIAGNNSMVYLFKPENAGTFYYHGHFTEQYPDGMYGVFIVHDPTAINTFSDLGSPYAEEGEEWIWTFADWYNVPAKDLMDWYLSPASKGHEPVPDSYTVNNQFSGTKMHRISNTSDPIRIRVINAAAFSMFTISIDGLPLQLIELGSSKVQPMDLQYLTLNVGQRCSFIIDFLRMDPAVITSEAIKIRIKVNQEMYPTYNKSLPNNGIIGSSSKIPTSPNWEALIVFTGGSTDIPNYITPPILNLPVPLDTNIIEARSLTATKAPKPELKLNIVIQFYNNADGVNLGYLNHQTYSQSRVTRTGNIPNVLFKYLAGQGSQHEFSSVAANNKTLITVPNQRLVLPFGKVIEIFINNTDSGEHPFHIHGHSFWVISSSAFPNAETLYRNNYLIRDVLSIPGRGWAKIRFIANNPGVWQLHCHITWHVAAGMVMDFIESPKSLAAGFNNDPVRPFSLVPMHSSHKAACDKPMKRIIRIGGYFNVFDSTDASVFDRNQAQCLTAFLMAIQEINSNPALLPNYELQVAIRGGANSFAGAIISAEEFTGAISSIDFSSTRSYVSDGGSNVGVDLLIGAGTDGNIF